MGTQLEQLLGYFDRADVSELTLCVGKPITMHTSKGVMNVTGRALTYDQLASLVRGTPLEPVLGDPSFARGPVEIALGDRAVGIVVERGAQTTVRITNLDVVDNSTQRLMRRSRSKSSQKPTERTRTESEQLAARPAPGSRPPERSPAPAPKIAAPLAPSTNGTTTGNVAKPPVTRAAYVVGARPSTGESAPLAKKTPTGETPPLARHTPSDGTPPLAAKTQPIAKITSPKARTHTAVPSGTLIPPAFQPRARHPTAPNDPARAATQAQLDAQAMQAVGAHPIAPAQPPAALELDLIDPPSADRPLPPVADAARNAVDDDDFELPPPLDASGPPAIALETIPSAVEAFDVSPRPSGSGRLLKIDVSNLGPLGPPTQPPERRAAGTGNLHAPADTARSLEALGLPVDLAVRVARERTLVLITAPDGYGTTRTLAALVDGVDRTVVPHVVTIDPLQSRDTLELALATAESGYCVIATLTASSPQAGLDAALAFYPGTEQARARMRLAAALGAVIAIGPTPSDIVTGPALRTLLGA